MVNTFSGITAVKFLPVCSPPEDNFDLYINWTTWIQWHEMKFRFHMLVSIFWFDTSFRISLPHASFHISFGYASFHISLPYASFHVSLPYTSFHISFRYANFHIFLSYVRFHILLPYASFHISHPYASFRRWKYSSWFCLTLKSY